MALADPDLPLGSAVIVGRRGLWVWIWAAGGASQIALSIVAEAQRYLNRRELA